MIYEAFVWLLDEKREVLLTDDPGPPVGGILVGSWPLPDAGWGDARKIAEERAKELSYEFIVESRFISGD